MINAMRFFLPTQVVFFESDQSLRYYAFRFRWDGGFTLCEKHSLSVGKPFVLLLDSALPFRRNFQFSITQRIKREFILASAAGLFPFALDDYVCSLGTKDAESYLFAIKNSDYEAIIAAVGQPAAVLVSDSNESAMMSAVQSWMNDKSVYALHSHYLPINPAKLLSGVLITATFIATMLAWGAWSNYFQGNVELIQQQAADVTKKAEPLLHKRMALSHMLSAYKAFDKLTDQRSEKLLRLLMPMLGVLPPECYVEKVQFENGRLEVYGWGTIPVSWFVERGISEKNYRLDALPNMDRFMFFLTETDNVQ